MQGKLFVDEHYSVKTDLDAMEANFWERCISTDNLYIVYYRNVICNNLQDKANVRKQESICWYVLMQLNVGNIVNFCS